MSEQIPTIGRIVHYKLNADDATQINRRRTTGTSIADRIRQQVLTPDMDDAWPKTVPQWPLGAQAHIGNTVAEGDTFPMIITRVWSSTSFSGQVFLDSNDVFWATSRPLGDQPGQFNWPPRV